MLTTLLIGAVSWTVLTPAAGSPSPASVAVLPFKRIVGDRGTPRLQQAIAETLSLDLRRSGRSVVAWEKVWAAVDWRRFYRQSDPWSDQEAAAVGRTVGADTVVWGTYHYPGGQVQMRGRLLSCTGQLIREATAEGPTETILCVQEELLSQLFGNEVRPGLCGRQKEAASGSERDVLRAYRLYALALQGTKRHRYDSLKDALERDDSFVYAREKKARIEQDARTLARVADGSSRQIQETMRELLDDGAIPADACDDRIDDLFRLLEETGHCRELVTLAEQAYRMSWPAPDPCQLRSVGLYYVVRGQLARNNPSEARVAGREYLEAFPSGRQYKNVSAMVGRMEKEAGKREKAAAKLPEKLAGIARRRVKVEQRRAQILFNHYQYLQAIRAAEEFVQVYSTESDPEIIEVVNQARWVSIRAYLALGDFVAARSRAQELLQLAPDFAHRLSIPTLLQQWPRG